MGLCKAVWEVSRLRGLEPWLCAQWLEHCPWSPFSSQPGMYLGGRFSPPPGWGNVGGTQAMRLMSCFSLSIPLPFTLYKNQWKTILQ